jgi:prepilin-type N-terminal cleavage/methylation domain-containing protein
VIRNSSSRTNGPAGFTILELLIVITIIAVLAGLTIATMGYVSGKARRSRAEAEIAAISAALENYKADNGVYPSDTATDALVPTIGDPKNYVDAGVTLYQQLSGDQDKNPSTPGDDTKNYLGALAKPANVATGGGGSYLRDPFPNPTGAANPYGYSTAQANGKGTGYNPTYDLWSTCGETGPKPPETFQQYQARWVKNW